MEHESLSAQIVKLQIINTKFKARILELEAQLAEEKQRTFVQYERAVGFSALNATLEARLKEAEASRDKLWREQHTIIVRAEGYLISIDKLTERASACSARAEAAHNAQRKVEQEALAVCAELDEATADARRLRALILSKGQELCPCWHLPKKCLKFFRENGEDARCLYCQVAALSPAEKADDEKGVKG